VSVQQCFHVYQAILVLANLAFYSNILTGPLTGSLYRLLALTFVRSMWYLFQLIFFLREKCVF